MSIQETGIEQVVDSDKFLSKAEKEAKAYALRKAQGLVADTNKTAKLLEDWGVGSSWLKDIQKSFLGLVQQFAQAFGIPIDIAATDTPAPSEDQLASQTAEAERARAEAERLARTRLAVADSSSVDTPGATPGQKPAPSQNLPPKA